MEGQQGGFVKISRALAFIAAASVAITLVGTAAASHSWGRYHWERAANPFTLQLGDNVSDAWNPYLGTASSDWTASEVLDTQVAAGGTTGSTCSPMSGRIEVCSAAYGATGWLGLAQIWLSGGHIYQGVTKMNDSYFNLAKYNNPNEKQHVMCQEVGHTFGLDHQDENQTNPNLGTCMDYTNDPTSNQHPNTHDYAELVTIYTHLDSTTTVGAALAAAGRPQVGNDASTWGTRVEGSQSAGHSTYVRDFGGGNKVITFVTWA